MSLSDPPRPPPSPDERVLRRVLEQIDDNTLEPGLLPEDTTAPIQIGFRHFRGRTARVAGALGGKSPRRVRSEP